jgi:hypothetical protein
MEPTTLHKTETSAPKLAADPAGKSANELPVELDRRGKPLPLRQRVGGIITPQ